MYKKPKGEFISSSQQIYCKSKKKKDYMPVIPEKVHKN